MALLPRRDLVDDTDRAEDELTRVIGPGLAFFALCALFILWRSFTGQNWVPLLDSANLAMHEAGHPLFGMLSERLAVYGGTLMQLVFPLATTIHFLRRRETLSTAFCALWLAQNLLNIGRYMADARAMELPLVGGLDPEESHDWRIILMRWGLLQQDTLLAGVLRGGAALAIVGLVAWVALRWWRDRLTDPLAGSRTDPFPRD